MSYYNNFATVTFAVAELATRFSRERCRKEGRPWYAIPTEEEITAATDYVKWLIDMKFDFSKGNEGE